MTRLVDNRRARLTEYTPWLFRDYAMNQGASTLIIMLLLGFLTFLPFFQGMVGGQAYALRELPADVALRGLRAIVLPFVLIATLAATNGIVATDRKMGYYRLLFAKPVSPVAYYATTFVTYGVGLAAVTLILAGLYTLAVQPKFPAMLLVIITLMFIAYGGIGFLLSAMWRYDWLSLITVYSVANVCWGMWSKSTSVLHWLLYVLPPVHRAEEVYGLLTLRPGEAVPWAAIAWLVGYGLACFFLGLLVLRKRSLGT